MIKAALTFYFKSLDANHDRLIIRPAIAGTKFTSLLVTVRGVFYFQAGSLSTLGNDPKQFQP